MAASFVVRPRRCVNRNPKRGNRSEIALGARSQRAATQYQTR
jgi:hypothetical protein